LKIFLVSRFVVFPISLDMFYICLLLSLFKTRFEVHSMFRYSSRRFLPKMPWELPFGGGKGPTAEWFSREAPTKEEDPFPRIFPKEGDKEKPTTAEPERENRVRSKFRILRGAPGHQPDPDADRMPQGASDPFGGPTTIADSRELLFELQQRSGVSRWQVLEAELRLITMLTNQGREKDCREVLRIGDKLWTEIEKKEVVFPENYRIGTEQLAVSMSRAAALLKDAGKAALWRDRADHERGKTGFMPSGARPADAEGNEKKEGDSDEEFKMHKRKSGAFITDDKGDQKPLFHNQHPMFDVPWRKNALKDGKTWDDGERFPR
jgi:hypothetical protein